MSTSPHPAYKERQRERGSCVEIVSAATTGQVPFHVCVTGAQAPLPDRCLWCSTHSDILRILPKVIAAPVELQHQLTVAPLLLSLDRSWFVLLKDETLTRRASRLLCWLLCIFLRSLLVMITSFQRLAAILITVFLCLWASSILRLAEEAAWGS